MTTPIPSEVIEDAKAAGLDFLHDVISIDGNRVLGIDSDNTFMASFGFLERFAQLQRLREHSSKEVAECKWKAEDDENMPGTYNGICGVMYSFMEGGIKENTCNFCPQCGGKVIEAIPTVEESK
jgi:hypothetical protein